MARTGAIPIAWAIGVAGLLQACDSEEGAHPPAEQVERAGSTVESTSAPAPRPSSEPESVSFSTLDGVVIDGTLRRGGEADAPAVVLVHQLSSSRQEWAPVVEALAEAPGLTTLAIDMRGHGESTRGPDGATLDWRQFERDEWSLIANDVVAAVNFLESHAELEPRRIVGVGSSIGSSAVIVAAGRDERIDAVVALSPGRAYRGVDAITPVAALGSRPLLAIASEEEKPAVEAAQAMAHVADRGRVSLNPGSAHGLAILATASGMADELVGFIRGPE